MSTEDNEHESVRIISARPADPDERREYEEGTRDKDDMRDHYDFRGGARGKYATRYAEGTNVVVLDPDVAAMFPDRESVNAALRAVGHVVEMRERRQARSNKGAPPDGGHGVARAKPAGSRSGRGG